MNASFLESAIARAFCLVLLLGSLSLARAETHHLKIGPDAVLTEETLESVRELMSSLGDTTEGEIYIEIDSIGGQIQSAIEIAQLLKSSPVAVRTHTNKGCHGAAVLVLAAGTSGNRSCSATSQFTKIGTVLSPKVAALFQGTLVQMYGNELGTELMTWFTSVTSSTLSPADVKAGGIVDHIK